MKSRKFAGKLPAFFLNAAIFEQGAYKLEAQIAKLKAGRKTPVAYSEPLMKKVGIPENERRCEGVSAKRGADGINSDYSSQAHA